MNQHKVERLLDRIREGLNLPQGTLTGVVQDCLTVARLAAEAEWELYFEIQLIGVQPGMKEGALPLGWKGDPSSLTWQPAVALFHDRKGYDGQVNVHALETLEFLLGQLEKTLGEPPSHPLVRDLDDPAAFDVKRQVMESRKRSEDMAHEIRALLARLRTRVRQFVSHVESSPVKQPSAAAPAQVPCIFIGHGRSPIWKDLAHFVSERLGLRYEEFNRESAACKPTSQRLLEMMEKASFAFLVLTGEDEQPDGKRRARQNVIHEAGLLQGKLGFERAIVLLEEDCEEFSNIEGLGQVRFPKGNVLAKAEEIRQVLEREDLIPDTRRGKIGAGSS